MTDETCTVCGSPLARYGCSAREEGSYCRGPSPAPPSTRPRTLIIKRTHPVPPSAPTKRCALCSRPVVWIIADDFRRLTVDPVTGEEHQPLCPKRRC